MNKQKKITVPKILDMKREGRKISALTAYDASFASIEDEAGIDIILTGDSAGMVIHGLEDTLSVTLDEMIIITRSVSRNVKHALLIADMPFGSYHISTEQGCESALRLMKEGRAQGVKLEGGGEFVLPTIKRLTSMGIPVMGHLGLTPQSVHKFGGHGLRGAEEKEAFRIIRDARALQDAGVFALVLEKIPMELAEKVTSELKVPTIGIASGPHCDGQILVAYDMLGIGKYSFRFARKYLDGRKVIGEAVSNYIEDIRTGKFPSEEESYSG